MSERFGASVSLATPCGCAGVRYHRPVTYQVLARTWRPQRFADLLGQDAVVQTLQNALTAGHLRPRLPVLRPARGRQDHRRPPAGQGGQLRAGPDRRSRAASASPAARSPRRRASTWSSSTRPPTPASTTSASCRSLLRYRPTRDRFRVIIIDEVHMLSTRGLQRPAEEPRGAAAVRPLDLRHHRAQQGPGHHPVALPAARVSAACRSSRSPTTSRWWPNGRASR